MDNPARRPRPDVCIAFTRPIPGLIKTEWIRGMAKDAIVFACANPAPEIWPVDAKQAGARIVATGRNDFPNQLNNSLVFPGIFRGTLDARASKITDDMTIAAALELASCAEEAGLREDAILPTMADWKVVPRIAAATALKAQEQGLARMTRSRDEYIKLATRRILESRHLSQTVTEAAEKAANMPAKQLKDFLDSHNVQVRHHNALHGLYSPGNCVARARPWRRVRQDGHRRYRREAGHGGPARVISCGSVRSQGGRKREEDRARVRNGFSGQVSRM
jgi:Malic enzyme, NAD binding domain